MILTLPYPISSNRYWRSFVPRGHTRAIVVVSDEAKAYKSEVGWIAKAAGCRPTTKPVSLRVTLVPKNGVVMDLGNCLKVAEDALQGVVYVNDKQVRKIELGYGEPDGVGALVVEVEEFVAALPPLFAEVA